MPWCESNCTQHCLAWPGNLFAISLLAGSSKPRESLSAGSANHKPQTTYRGLVLLSAWNGCSGKPKLLQGSAEFCPPQKLVGRKLHIDSNSGRINPGHTAKTTTKPHSCLCSFVSRFSLNSGCHIQAIREGRSLSANCPHFRATQKMGLLNVTTALGYLQDAVFVWMHTLLLMRVRTQGRGTVTDVSASGAMMLLIAGLARLSSWAAAPHMALLLKMDVEGIMKEAGRGDSITALLSAVLGGFYSRPGMHYAVVATAAAVAAAATLWHGWSWHGHRSPGTPPNTVLQKHDPASVLRAVLLSLLASALYVLQLSSAPVAVALRAKLQAHSLSPQLLQHDAVRSGLALLLLTWASALTAAAVLAQCRCWVELRRVTPGAEVQVQSAHSQLQREEPAQTPLERKNASKMRKAAGDSDHSGGTPSDKPAADGAAAGDGGYSEQSAGALPQSGTVTAMILLAILWGVVSFLLASHGGAHPKSSPAFAAGVPGQPWAWGSYVDSHARGAFVALALLLGLPQLRLRRGSANRSAVGVLCVAAGVAALLPALMSNASLRRSMGVSLDMLGRPCMSGLVAGIVSAVLMGGPAAVVCLAAVAAVVNALIAGVGGTDAAAMAARYAGRNKGSFFTGM